MSRWFPCIRWRPVTARAAMWLLMVVTIGWVIGEQRHEANVREQQLCQVVINVHNNSVARYEQSKRSLKVTQQFLADPQSKDSPALRRRIVETLPTTKKRVETDKGSVRATQVPPVCQKYVWVDLTV